MYLNSRLNSLLITLSHLVGFITFLTRPCYIMLIRLILFCVLSFSLNIFRFKYI